MPDTLNTVTIRLQPLTEPAAVRAWSEGRTIYLELVDGRIFGFPADRFRILSRATQEQLSRVEVQLNGFALRWEELDEDLTVSGIVAGRFQLPLPEPMTANADRTPLPSGRGSC